MERYIKEDNQYTYSMGVNNLTVADVVCFHSTYPENLAGTLGYGGIKSGLKLEVDGDGADESLKLVSPVSRKIYKLRECGSERFKDEMGKYNQVHFTMQQSDPHLRYQNTFCPIGFGFHLFKLVENYDVFINREEETVAYDKNGGLTTVLMKDSDVLFFPDDVYFDQNGQLIDFGGYSSGIGSHFISNKRLSYGESIRHVGNHINSCKTKLKSIDFMKDLLMSVGVLDDVKIMIKEVFDDVYKDSDDFSEYGFGGICNQFKDAFEFDSFSALNALGSKAMYFMDSKLETYPGFKMINSFKYKVIDSEEPLAEFKQLYEYDKDNCILDSISYIFGMFKSLNLLKIPSMSKRAELEMIYSENKEQIDDYVQKLNEYLGNSFFNKINSGDFETIAGRYMYHNLDGVLAFINSKKEWVDYKQKCEFEGYIDSKRYLLDLLKSKGAELSVKDDGSYSILNHEFVDLPAHVVFFGGDGSEMLSDVIDKYLINDDKLLLDKSKYHSQAPNLMHGVLPDLGEEKELYV